MSPSGPTSAKNNSALNDLSLDSSRQQTFASAGDAVFMPKNSADHLSFRPHDNPFLSAPLAPLENPFMASQTSPPNGNATDGNPQITSFRHNSQESMQPLPRTGIALSNDTRHSSPSLSVGSASVMTSQQSQQQHVVQDQHYQNNHSLPLIPDIKKDMHKHSVQRESAPTQGLKNENHYQLKVLFSTRIANAYVRKNPKNGYFDVWMKIMMQASPTGNSAIDSKATHIIHKWYSELSTVHERLNLSQHGIAFPGLRFTNNQQEGPVSESDIQGIQKYISTITDSFLNVDHRNQIAQQFLSFLEDESKSLSDKIRMLLLEARLVSTMNCCDQLQNRLNNAEKSLAESSNLVSFLKFRVEQLESTGPVPRRVSAAHPQGDHLRQQAYGLQSHPSSSSYSSSVDHPMLLQNMHLDGRNNAIPGVPAGDSIINPAQLVTLAESVLNEKGPLPVGEVGKMLQEATGNPSLSQILKERHNGLKKFLEKYSDKFIMSCDHPFNPHVYLRRSYGPDDQRVIESGSTAFLDKKAKKPRRKEKKTWPVGVPSPTLGSWNQTRVYS